jgi:molybdenum cofactor biosynthesis protein B
MEESYYNRSMSRSSDVEHKAAAPRSIGCCVVTISDTRTDATDTSGRAIVTLLEAAGHRIAARTIVKDDTDLIRSAIDRELANPEVQVIVTTGGTGITSRDNTYEVVNGMLDKRLDGFGELFRMISYEQIGSAAMLSRACAGLAGGRIIVSLPGSEAAVRLAMERLILPELGHMVQQASR